MRVREAKSQHDKEIKKVRVALKDGTGTERAGMTNWVTKNPRVEGVESSCWGCRNDRQSREHVGNFRRKGDKN